MPKTGVVLVPFWSVKMGRIAVIVVAMGIVINMGTICSASQKTLAAKAPVAEASAAETPVSEKMSIKSVKITGGEEASMVEVAILEAFLKSGSVKSDDGFVITGTYEMFFGPDVTSPDTKVYSIIHIKMTGIAGDEVVALDITANDIYLMNGKDLTFQELVRKVAKDIPEWFLMERNSQNSREEDVPVSGDGNLIPR